MLPVRSELYATALPSGEIVGNASRPDENVTFVGRTAVELSVRVRDGAVHVATTITIRAAITAPIATYWRRWGNRRVSEPAEGLAPTGSSRARVSATNRYPRVGIVSMMAASRASSPSAFRS